MIRFCEECGITFKTDQSYRLECKHCYNPSSRKAKGLTPDQRLEAKRAAANRRYANNPEYRKYNIERSRLRRQRLREQKRGSESHDQTV